MLSADKSKVKQELLQTQHWTGPQQVLIRSWLQGLKQIQKSYKCLITSVTNKAQWHPDLKILRSTSLVQKSSHLRRCGCSPSDPHPGGYQHLHRILWKPQNLQWSISVIKFFPLLFIYWLERDKLNQTAKFLSPRGVTIAGLYRIQVDMAQLQSGKTDGCLFTNGDLMRLCQIEIGSRNNQ